ncbi:MAG TPA: electron transfer flavoprotein subunit alpha/FixB family protein [Syntrophomonadaceae bacterium]|nr:electron transfer flavoprotein subunit alpha/FixB family protein [Syntrophomonadaceae bacterium]
MASVLIYSDKLNLALELISAAKTINPEVTAVAINDAKLAQGLAAAGVKVWQVNNDAVNVADTAVLAQAIADLADKAAANTVLLASNRRGRELAGRLAQKLEAGCLTNVSSMKIDGDKVECMRNALGGATVATQVIIADKQVIAIAPKSFEPASGSPASVEDVDVEVTPKVKVLEVRTKAADAVDIEAAEVLVVAGQGVNSQADLADIEALAKKLGGEVACTKPVATDKKWLSEERVVGLSGKICKPDLAILLGVSGQVQFTVGIRDAKSIVSVNTDENANMNQMSDYILTADLHEVVKELSGKL